MITLILVSILIVNTPLSVSTTDDALATLANPAGLGVGRDFNFYYLYDFGSTDSLIPKRDFWHNQTFVLQINNLGISYIDMTDFRVGIGSKLTDNFLIGTTYRRIHSKNFWDAGILYRPLQYLSVGAVVQNIGHKTTNQFITGIGIRPLTNRVTLTCDFYSDEWNMPRIGLETEPINGLELKSKIIFDSLSSFSLQIGINVERLSIGSIFATSIQKNSARRSVGYFRISKDQRRSLTKQPPHYLELKLNGSIGDQKSDFSLFGNSTNHTTYEILQIINKAKKDKTINGIVLKIENPQYSFAVVQEIKLALEDFKKQNKKLIVYAPNMGMLDYYLACSGHKIITHPLGETHIPGISTRSLFLKGTLDKLGLEYDYERIGKHKNAPEMFTQDTMSLATREVLNSILDDLYEQIISSITKARNLSIEDVQQKINVGFYSAQEAQTNQLVDGICYEDELDSLIKVDHKLTSKITAKRFNEIKEYNYNWSADPKIALLYANGEITQGESSSDFIMGGNTCGANTMVRTIRKIRKDNNTKAIILRVDSPGGDGFASDLIFRELTLAQKTKPVIVSMGSVAASGGYYISMMADKIFVSPATITGSIGVFSAKIVTRDMYRKLGITTETIKRGDRADAFSTDRKFNDAERLILQNQLQNFYHQFISKVAQYRNLTLEYVDSIGQGRIWTGNQAQQNKLADTLGNLINAINYAQEKAHIKEYTIVTYPKLKRGFLNTASRVIKILLDIIR